MDEFDDRLLRRAFVPGGQRIVWALAAAAALTLAAAPSMRAANSRRSIAILVPRTPPLSEPLYPATRSSCLPSFLPSNRRLSVAGAFSRPCCTSTRFLSLPSLTQPARAPIASSRAACSRYEEALHPPALRDQVEIVPRPRRRFGGVVGRDAAAEHDPAAHREPRKRRVEDRTADIVEEDVDALGHSSLAAPSRFGLVVDRRVQPEVLREPAAFLRSARNPDDAAAFDLRDLADERAGRARGAGDDDGFALSGRPTSRRPK